jgi:hypothetical protein
MTNERRPKPTQRYSRFSQSTYDDVLPPPPDEPSFAEIAMRALNGHHGSAPDLGPAGRDSGADRGWDQPPPPDPSVFWEMETREAPNPAPRPVPEPDPLPAVPPRPSLMSMPIEAEFSELPRERKAAPQPHDPLDEMSAKPEPQIRLAEPAPGQKAEKRRDRKLKRAGGKGAAALAAVAGTVRTKAAPALVNGSLWLAHNLRRREIRRRYNRALVFGHTRIADRKLEPLFFIPTRKSEVINPAVERGIHYDGPVSSAVFDWIMALMPSDLRQYAFVDIRAGRGRTSLLASKLEFNRIIAYEYDAETFDDLQMNVAQYPRSRMKCRDVDCYRGDVDGIRLPDQPCVIWFSSAWREPMIAGVMNYVRETYRQSPRRIYVVLENTADDTAIASDNIFDPIDPPLAERLKLRLLSPVDFKVYRSLV